MIELWVVAALVAMLANVAKVLLVKTRCREIDSWLLVFLSRFFPGLILLCALFLVDYQILDLFAFWGATVAAAVITIGASLLYMNAVKTGHLSVVTPIQASIPMFMIGCTWILYGERPEAISFVFIALIVGAVFFVLRFSSKDNKLSQSQTPAIVRSFIAAALFGISTVLDRVAISAATEGALVFSAYWNLVTVVLLIPVIVFRRARSQNSLLSVTPSMALSVGIYVLVVLLAFLAQQYAVQWSLDLDNGVTYVKTVVMAHIVLAALFGVVSLKENGSRSLYIANGVTLVSGVGLLWTI